jgi:2-polyprenyl-3-methyl-5-hydroxy-6-metoxy-1,4-benzoquinol methylase
MASLGRYRRIQEILRRVETGQFISDSFFDELYPKRLKLRSPRHYTPVEVAMRVGELISPDGGERVLDVGSGAGKFTIAAALCGKGFFTGVDMDPSLCEVASELAKDFGLGGGQISSMAMPLLSIGKPILLSIFTIRFMSSSQTLELMILF